MNTTSRSSQMEENASWVLSLIEAAFPSLVETFSGCGPFEFIPVVPSSDENDVIKGLKKNELSLFNGFVYNFKRVF